MNVKLGARLVESGARRGDDDVKCVPDAEGFQGPLQKWVIDRAGDDADGNPRLVDLPHGRDRSWNRRGSRQRLPHEMCDTIPHVVFSHLKPHSTKNLFQTGFGGQLVPVLDDLLTQLPVAAVGLVELSGADVAGRPLCPPAKKR